jgi:hypothetical protein
LVALVLIWRGHNRGNQTISSKTILAVKSLSYEKKYGQIISNLENKKSDNPQIERDANELLAE